MPILMTRQLGIGKLEPHMGFTASLGSAQGQSTPIYGYANSQYPPLGNQPQNSRYVPRGFALG
jgi:hypothetical protein